MNKIQRQRRIRHSNLAKQHSFINWGEGLIVVSEAAKDIAYAFSRMQRQMIAALGVTQSRLVRTNNGDIHQATTQL